MTLESYKGHFSGQYTASNVSFFARIAFIRMTTELLVPEKWPIAPVGIKLAKRQTHSEPQI